MKHQDLPHIQKFIDNEETIDFVITLLEDMRDECGSNGVRNAAILARDTHKCLCTVKTVVEAVKAMKKI